MKKFIFLSLILLSNITFANNLILDCNNSVLYRTHIKIEEMYPESKFKILYNDNQDAIGIFDQTGIFNSIMYESTIAEEQNLQVNNYSNDKIEIKTKYEVPSCKIRKIEIKIRN